MKPSSFPSKSPTTSIPTQSPSDYPTKFPSQCPSSFPSKSPSTSMPTKDPSTSIPTKSPSDYPTKSPTMASKVVTLDMECTDTEEWLEGLKAELQAAVDKMEGDVTVSDVACGSVLVTIEGNDLTQVETVEEIIVNEGVVLPNYGRVGGPIKLKEETAEEGAEDW